MFVVAATATHGRMIVSVMGVTVGVVAVGVVAVGVVVVSEGVEERLLVCFFHAFECHQRLEVA